MNKETYQTLIATMASNLIGKDIAHGRQRFGKLPTKKITTIDWSIDIAKSIAFYCGIEEEKSCRVSVSLDGVHSMTCDAPLPCPLHDKKETCMVTVPFYSMRGGSSCSNPLPCKEHEITENPGSSGKTGQFPGGV